jgi:hypothetical protein
LVVSVEIELGMLVVRKVQICHFGWVLVVLDLFCYWLWLCKMVDLFDGDDE